MVVKQDVEHRFGMLQSWFAILQNPSRQWHQEIVSDIMVACVIFYNMIIEDEYILNLEFCFKEHVVQLD
jgi:hypothetical protein